MTGARALDEELALERDLAVARAQRSLLGFIRHVTPHFSVSWHHRFICGLMDRVVTGDLKRVIVSTPPRHGKSEILSRHLPAYLFGRNPDETVISTSYAADLAQRMSRDCQRIIDSDAYREVFPGTQLYSSNIRTVAQGTWLRNADIFEIVGRRGVYRAAGIGAGVTGMGMSLGIIDDFCKNAEEASSETVRTKVWEWFNAVFRTRLAKAGRIVVLATRWHDSDLIGRIVQQMNENTDVDQWHVVNLPALKVGPPTHDDPRDDGEALWPDFFPREELLKIKAASAKTWASLYMGDPVDSEQSILNPNWWRFCRRADRPAHFDRVIMSVDLSFADRGDFTCAQVWGKHGGCAYLLAQAHRRMRFTEQIEAVLRLRDEWPGLHAIVVEEAANGAALLDTLRSQVPNLVAVKPRTSKVNRVEAITPIVEAGNVFLPDPREAPWVDDLLAECCRFPFGAYDDRVDALAYGIGRLFPPRQAHIKALPQDLRRASPWTGARGR